VLKAGMVEGTEFLDHQPEHVDPLYPGRDES